MDSLISLVGDGFVLSAADTNMARSVVVMKRDLDKVVDLDENKMLSVSGDWADVVEFSQRVRANVHLMELRSGIRLSSSAVANFTRNILATSIRCVDGMCRGAVNCFFLTQISAFILLLEIRFV